MCDLKRCRQPTAYTYYDHAVCENHWVMYCNDEIDLKEILGVKE